MLQGFDLRAGETYPSIWVPADPADTNTYYPQAIFRNGLSFAVIGTVNLTKQTDGSYKGNFTVPQDPSGLGMIIVETLTIYNDSAHSDSVTQYQIEQIKHKIVNANANFSGGGGDYTDYQYIEKMVKKIIEEAIATIKFEQKDVDFSSLESGIKKIKDRQRPHRKLLEQLGGRIEALEKKQIEFVVTDEVGSGFNKQYIVDVLINNIRSGTGRDYSIKKAEQNAAEKALENIVKPELI